MDSACARGITQFLFLPVNAVRAGEIGARVARFCLVAAAVAFFVPDRSTLAQELTGPVTTPAPRAEPSPPPWRLDVSTGVGYDDNLRFTNSMESATSGNLHAGLSRVISGRRTTLTLGAAGDGTVYRPIEDFDQLNYSANASANYLFSPRTTLRVSDNFSKGYTSDSRVLIDAGLLLPRTVTRSNDVNLDLSHRISPYWTWNVSGRHRVTRFESNLLIDETSTNARADLFWTPTARSPIGLSYEFGHTDRQNRAGADLHGVTIWGQASLNEKVTIRLDAGAYKLLSSGVDGNHVVPSGGARLDYRSLKQSISLSALRSVGEAFGLGHLQVRSSASLRFERTLKPWMALGLHGLLNRSEDPSGDGTRRFDTTSAGGDLTFALSKNVALALASGYRGLETNIPGNTHSRFATLALKVGQTW